MRPWESNLTPSDASKDSELMLSYNFVPTSATWDSWADLLATCFALPQLSLRQLESVGFPWEGMLPKLDWIMRDISEFEDSDSRHSRKAP